MKQWMWAIPVALTVSACSAPAPKNVLYVTNERAGTLTMIDADTLESVGTLELGRQGALSTGLILVIIVMAGARIANPIGPAVQ